MTMITQLIASIFFPLALAATTPSIGDVSVRALQHNQVVSEMTASGETVIHQVHYTGLDSFSEPDNTEQLDVQGNNLPSGTVVTLTIPEAKMIQSVTTDSNGHWQILLPMAALPAGKHTVYMTTSDTMMAGESVAIAQFTVHTTQALSQATWIFLLSTFIAIVSLLIVITIQLHYNTSYYSVI